MKRTWRIGIFSVGTAVLLLLAWLILPWRILPADVSRVLMPRRAAWEGVLHVWNVTAWKPAKGSMTFALTVAAQRTEKRNRGLFVEVDSMDETTFLARLAAGDRPDLVSFSGGMDMPLRQEMVSMGDELPADLPAMLTAVAFDTDGVWAVPWMWGGELVLASRPVASQRGVALPEKGWTAEEMGKITASMAYTMRNKARTKVAGIMAADIYCLPWAMQNTAQAPVSDKAMTPSAAWETFAYGRTSMLVATQWEAGAMARLRAMNKGFDIAALPFPQDLPMLVQVQWIGMIRTQTAEKEAMMRLYVRELVGMATQKKMVEGNGCLPVVSVERLGASLDDVQQLLLQRAKGKVVLLRPGRALSSSQIAASARGDTQARLVVSHATWTGP